MKKVWVFLFSLFVILLIWGRGFSGNSTNDILSDKEFLRRWKEFREDLNQSLRNMQLMREGNWMGFYNENIRILSRTVPDMLKNCLDYGNDTIKLNVQYGRYISAFELCRRQGGGIDECIERVRKAKEEWRSRCKDPHQSLSLFYLKERARAEEVKQSLQGMVPLGGCYGEGLLGLASAQSCALMNQKVVEWFPGSQFNLGSGTGTIVLGDGVIYYQGWQFIQRVVKGPGGLIVQIFPKKINLVGGTYNIAVALGEGGKWDVIEFNLPFDLQTEKQLMALDKRVRLTNKEIIQLVDRYLKDTVWEADLLGTFQKLLLNGREREFFMESLLEYYTYDNYLLKVKADAERQEKALQQKQEEQPKQKQGGKKGKGRRA